MAMEKQKAYCEANKLPFFAPATGKCFKCGREVRDTDKALLTGCSHCHMTWCD